MVNQQRLLVLGVFQVLLGCIVGFIPPPAVLHFRSIVTAHIEYCVNGILLAVIGLLVPRMKLNGVMSFLLEFFAVVGTFTNGTAFVIAGFTGFGTKLAPTIIEKFPFPNGTEGGYSEIITNILMVCGVSMLISLSIALVGLLSYSDGSNSKKGN